MSTLNLLLIVTEAVLTSVALPLLAALLARACPKNAARRRLAWATMFAVLLALPLAAALSPSLTVIALHAPAPLVQGPMIAAAPPTADPPLSATAAALLFGLYAWIVGALWIVGRSMVGLTRLHLLKRGAERASPERLPLHLPRGPRVLLSPECTGPVTWGVIRPVILLPDDALDWPQPKLEAALRHELAHVNARDCLMQTLALLACALYWPNPLVWRAADNLRREAEAAADDAVLASGIRPSDYASLLLDLANDWAGTRHSELEMAMASPPILTERVQSILSPDAQRTGATAMDTLKIVLLGGAATAALALARPSVAEVPATPSASPPASPPAKAAAPAVQSTVHGQAIRNAADKPTTDQTVELAQQDAPAPRAATALPGIPPLPAPPAGVTPTTIIVQQPYNPVTDDPASPGYIPAGQPGAGHPVPANLAKLLNARKGGANAPWTLRWLPNPNGPATPPTSTAEPAPAKPADPPVAGLVALPPLPAAAPGQPHPRVVVGFSSDDGGPLTPQQRAELNRQLAAIGPKIEKALADAHIDDAVAKALKDAHIDETVDKAVKGIQPTIQKAITDARVREIVAQRLAAVDVAVVRAQEDAKRAEEQPRRAADEAARDSGRP